MHARKAGSKKGGDTPYEKTWSSVNGEQGGKGETKRIRVNVEP